jgi:hypothetical protein
MRWRAEHNRSAVIRNAIMRLFQGSGLHRLADVGNIRLHL